MKHKTIKMGGVWGDCVGEIDRTGVVFFWGNSGNGKTSAAVSFCIELCRQGLKGLYMSKEEGISLSMQETLVRLNAAQCGNKLQFDNGMDWDEFERKWSKPRSWDFALLDSIQYCQMNYRQYLAFKERHKNKLIIIISHCDGRVPAGRSAKSIMYDAGLKIWVEGYRAFSKGRFIGPKGSCTIWEEGAQKYWGGKMITTSKETTLWQRENTVTQDSMQ